MAVDSELARLLKSDLDVMLSELGKRASEARRLDRYYEGDCPLPDAIVKAGVTKAYRLLMPLAEAPWGSLIVDSVQDRLEVAGVRAEGVDTRELWDVAWQGNAMDAESLLGHNAALVSGRAFATVWPDPDDPDRPVISLDNAEQVIIRYREGSRRHRASALRAWEDEDGRKHCTLYRTEGLYKFVASKEQAQADGRIHAGDVWWEPRETGEPWPLQNPFNVVPVVELPVNRRLKAGAFPYARGEFAHCTGLIDRINLLTFLGLVVAFWMGFPLRGVIGDKIIRDDNNEPLPPFKIGADQIVQIEDPNAKFAEFSAADRKNLSVFAELDQLATITKTPRHYFPMEHGMSNLSADAIRASEGALHAKVPGHKGSLGEAWEEVLRLAGLMMPGEVVLPHTAELIWKDHETRSLAERADAATKLASIEGMPWPIVAELALGLTQEQMRQAESEAMGSVIGQLLRDAAGAQNGGGTTEPEPEREAA